MMSESPSGAERRRSSRRPYKSRGMAYVLCNSQITAMNVETRNISDGGVLIVSEELLQGERMMLKLDIPGFEDALVECDVAHRSEFGRLSIADSEDTLFACGLEFRRVIPIDDLHETLLTAFRLGEAETAANPEDAHLFDGDEAEASLVPLLSAIGLAVVYASQLTTC